MMRLSFCILLIASVGLSPRPSSSSTVYHVGPSQPYGTPSDVPWQLLSAGDSVYIHHRSDPYHHKWVICARGTEEQRIVIHGVPKGDSLPAFDASGDTTRSQLSFWNEDRGVIKIGQADFAPDLLPAWIIIENLEIFGAKSGVYFTGSNGLKEYRRNASAIYVEKGEHIVVRGCRFHHCGNGFFSAPGTSHLLVEANRIAHNSYYPDSSKYHNIYTESDSIIFQYNYLDSLVPGATGNNLKDRSADCIIRYNYIRGGGRQLDLVESNDPAIYDDPGYHQTFVYGNILIERAADTNSGIVHYGGDGGNTARYRKGWLYFFNNTVVSRRDGSTGTLNTTLLQLETSDESADVRNNIIYVTAPGSALAFLNDLGYVIATRNWVKQGWVVGSRGSGAVSDQGQVKGPSPGFVTEASDDFRITQTSQCRDSAASLEPAGLPDHRPVREYIKHQQSVPRHDDGLLDIGAYEYPAPSGVVVTALRGGGIRCFPNPFRTATTVLGQPSGAKEVLEVFDVRGRLVARLRPQRPGYWTWSPGKSAPIGIYLLRSGAEVVKVIRIE